MYQYPPLQVGLELVERKKYTNPLVFIHIQLALELLYVAFQSNLPKVPVMSPGMSIRNDLD